MCERMGWQDDAAIVFLVQGLASTAKAHSSHAAAPEQESNGTVHTKIAVRVHSDAAGVAPGRYGFFGPAEASSSSTAARWGMGATAP
jgi:hypothetical protein